MEYNFTNVDFRRLLKEKEEIIHRRYDGGFSENENFKQLLRILIAHQNNQLIKEYKTLLITKEEVKNICKDVASKLDCCLKSDQAIINNHIVIDRECNIVETDRKSYKDSSQARHFYNEISIEYCVFLIHPTGIHYFIDNRDFGHAIFFTSEDFESHSELKDVTEIMEVFDEYRKQLLIRDTYRKFFVSNSHKRSLHKLLYPLEKDSKETEKFCLRNKHLLENSPEDIFREDLRMFLKRKIKAQISIGKELLLESFKRLDIVIQDEFGELYFIEVKWVGISVHRDGQKFGSKIEEGKINPDAVIQTLNYIKELNEQGNKVKIGYLAVFDGRNESLTDTVKTVDDGLIDSELMKYYHRFRKIPDFKVTNTHPY